MNEHGFSDMKIGMNAEFQATVSDADLDRFTAMSGDSNPLHSDASYASDKGFRDRVVHGLLSSMYYSQLVGVHLPGHYCLLHSIDISFVAPCFPSQELTVSGKVHRIHDAFRQVEVKARIQDGNGETVSRAKIKVGFLDV